MTNDEFVPYIMNRWTGSPDKFPFCAYDPEGDILEFCSSPDQFFARACLGGLTVYISEDTREIVGFCLGGFSRFGTFTPKEQVK